MSARARCSQARPAVAWRWVLAPVEAAPRARLAESRLAAAGARRAPGPTRQEPPPGTASRDAGLALAALSRLGGTGVQLPRRSVTVASLRRRCAVRPPSRRAPAYRARAGDRPRWRRRPGAPARRARARSRPP